MNEVIDNLAVNRDASIGGNQTVAGDSHIKHNLRVDGWLEARNIKGPNKGMYLSYEVLKSVYPVPDEGWYALVGKTLPADIYIGRGGDWVLTGEKGGDVEIDFGGIDELEERMKNVEQNAKDASEAAQQTASEAKETAEHALELANAGLPTIELSELDNMVPSGLGAAKYDELMKGAPVLYAVTDNGYRIGVLEFFCDGGLRHVVTQKLTTHYSVADGVFTGSHSDAKVSMYWRSYNRNASSAMENEKGTWGKWREFNTEPAPNFSVETFYEVSDLAGIMLFPASQEELQQKPNGSKEKNSELNGIVFNTKANRFQHIIRSEETPNVATIWPVWVTSAGEYSYDAFGNSADNGIAPARGRLYYCKKDSSLYIKQGKGLAKVN